jgi:hypothetical protein
MDTTDALDDSLKQSRDEVLDLVDLADFENFLKLSQEQGLLNTVCERPVS